jgi:hypothetical protein
MSIFFSAFLQTTPDTSSYMVAGFAVIFGAMALYLASLYIRQKNLEQDIRLLEELGGAELEQEGSEKTEAV